MSTVNAATLDPSLVSIAAAHGITPRVVATWRPTLVRTPRVLVPIQLDVLMVRNANLSWANCGMTAPPAADPSGNTPPTPAASLMPPPFSELATSRPRGAYLQWYLPNGLTSGTSDSTTNEATFPAIPDRWLVIRFSKGNSLIRRALRGWILEAGGQPAAQFDLDGWTEPGPPTNIEKPLTALGHGDLSWAGYFDNVLDRLSFYDGTLDSDSVGGPIAYVVCGWYEDPTLDPLGDQSVTSLAAFNAKMAQLGWALDAGQLDEVTATLANYVGVATKLGLTSVRDVRLAATGSATAAYTTNGSWWPTSTLYHGAVVGIDWPGSRDTTEIGGPPDPSQVHVAIGNTMAEAMGAIVATADNAPSEAAIVEALQLGVVKELDQPDGRAQLDVQLHTSSFQSRPGGPATTEPLTIAPSGPPQAPPANPAAPGSGIFPQTSTGGVMSTGLHEVISNVSASQAQLTVQSGATGTVRSEEQIISGRLTDVIAKLNIGVTIPPTDPGGTIDVNRAAPRYFSPRDPIVLIQGGKRAFSHDSSVQTENGMVVCRLTPVSQLSFNVSQTASTRFTFTPPDVLERGVENGSVPVECEAIVGEAALLDSGGAPAMAASAEQSGIAVASTMTNIEVEQTAWYALRNPHVDFAPLLAHSGITGTLPAPFSIAPASSPWTPMHLDWEVAFVPSPNGIDDWTPGEIDFTLNANAVVPASSDNAITLSGRSPLTGGAAATLSSAITTTLQQIAAIGGTGPVPAGAVERFYSAQAQLFVAKFQTFQVGASGTSGSTSTQVNPSLLQDLATALSQMDVLSCGLNGVLTQLRGGVPGDGTSTPGGGVIPTPFFAMRAGFLRLIRLRLVDGFGQFVDLCGSNATNAAQGYLISGPMTLDGNAVAIALPPRFSAPSRMWFRFMSAAQPGVEADYQTSPVCAYVMPNHLEGSLEFFQSDGSNAGSLQPMSDGRVMWQDAPGTPSTTGQDPASALQNTYAAQFAQSLVDWGIADGTQSREPALSALLRTIDSTLWTVDPFGHAGDEHLALLVGHPICVMRALLRLDVNDPVVTPDGTLTAVPIRLGDLTQWQDGLLGYFVDDDYTVLHAADASAPGMARMFGPSAGFLQQIDLVPQFYTTFADDLPASGTQGATPVTHPYVDTSGILFIRPNQTINLTLLVEPLTTVHGTACLVPRKEIGMRRQWVQDGLAAIAPTFRFGPVLVDPQHIRMPLATDLNGVWVWDYRGTASSWTEDPTTNATDNASLGADPPTAIEGWLRLTPPPAKP